jgi:hypothetical protein
MRILIVLTAATLTACSTVPGAQPGPVAAANDWRTIATTADRQRLREWRTAFTRALAQARAAGHSADIAAEGKLLDPDAALGPVPIPNGNYKCRVIKVGAKQPGLLEYIAYPAFNCRIAQEMNLQSLNKLNGSQRQTGLLFPDSAVRQAFLGTLVLGDETHAMQYGADAERDLAGWVERVGDNRWRLVLPYPHYESVLDVVELVPAR